MKHTVGVVAVLVGGSLVAASAGQLRQFAPGSVAVGGEIGRRMDVTLEKMLHHTDIDGMRSGSCCSRATRRRTATERSSGSSEVRRRIIWYNIDVSTGGRRS